MKRLVLAVLLIVVAGCDRNRGMETRTFELHRLTNDEALALLTPYITEGGRLSGKNRLITVQERPERMKVIEEVLGRYDGNQNAVDVMLHVQVIEAN